jgi:hypothetical protein
MGNVKSVFLSIIYIETANSSFIWLTFLLPIGSPGFNPESRDRLSWLRFSSYPVSSPRCRDDTNNQATADSFHILSKSLFSNRLIVFLRGWNLVSRVWRERTWIQDRGSKWRLQILQNYELRILFSINITVAINPRGMRWAGHVACMV